MENSVICNILWILQMTASVLILCVIYIKSGTEKLKAKSEGPPPEQCIRSLIGMHGNSGERGSSKPFLHSSTYHV